MKSEFEEKLSNAAATAAAATLQHEQEIRAAISQSEEKSKDRIEKLEAAVAEARKDEDVGPRNLVVCIDGTANQFGIKNSNVVELYHLLVKDKRQITFYNSGIGTYAKPSWRSLSYWRQAIGHTIDLMIAWNYERIIQEAYLWLSENYRDGDRVFLFGFSRGAYQVRCLSAMIDTVGLIHRGNDAQIPLYVVLYILQHYVSDDPKEMAKRFKKSFSREVQVHFVGAWDTVSSVGIVRDKVLPGTTSGMKHVTFFRHALALDERRVKFLPEYAYEGSHFPDAKRDTEEKTRNVSNTTLAMHRKGAHVSLMNRSDPPLRWMSYEATAAGLRLEPFTREWEIQSKINVHESLAGPWYILEYLRLTHLTYDGASNVTRWYAAELWFVKVSLTSML
ncbi:uncharacterized protein STEHIDRAFT_69324 [Stereum hirsutum FP-91666 SS1]|uniref:T6SS Phospholipase effector Tle1-like catalytic domain-containing protein n=1 Tax=Stereum hirsutum (strain FP-91666) TaxID=721885 RepID=R7RXG8_STEHR|nr:uncharacterized protein STEHIDRAFT_69324 [Stereum hirsutum FP-91666 SS1]EIM79565.1 hypothetical protein STEHIDRAFT_69324 [Stereum hirsutum FP-91666 SS1]